MDAYEATKIVFSRIQSIEPETVSKIVGYLLLQDHGDREMIRLAFGPDTLIQSLISKTKKELGLQAPSSSSQASTHLLTPYNLTNHSDLQVQLAPFSHVSSRPFPSPTALSPQTLYWDSHTPQESPLNSHNLHVPHEQRILNFNQNSFPDQFFATEKLHPGAYINNEQFSIRDYVKLQDPLSFLDNDYFTYPEMHIAAASLNGTKMSMDYLNSGAGKRPTSIAEVKPCLYFARGYCKHGSTCRFLHGYSTLENLIPVPLSSSPSESVNEEPISAGSLERLELELLELLRGKRAPISIASLPQLYYERYGRTLQAEGYLTESQRHGKAGYSLTKLLARLKNTVRLIDRPHGQHAVVLAEDAPKFTEYRSERNDIAGLIAGSRQIYLTFPAESTFTEEDVSNYFRTYGPVHDVRIPYQQKRMFGFVTFVYPETVKIILNKGNPHYVCGARVLVKPYREKGKHGDRKYIERTEHSKYMPAIHNLDLEYDMPLGPRIFDNSETIRRQLLEEQDQAIELERRRLAELRIMNQVSTVATNNVIGNQEHQNHLDGKASEDHFSYLLEVLNSESINGEIPKHNNNDQESHGHNLPESPFATTVALGSYAGNDIATAT
eukprot:Gb_29751 [translate_table: standard]